MPRLVHFAHRLIFAPTFTPLLLAIFVAVGPAEASPPNIVLVIADDMTFRDCGAYGSLQVRTPHIDRLAASGMTFDQAFTSTAMCAPTRQQLYTGIWPVRNGAYPNHSRVYDGVRSFVQHFQQLGYRVGLAGKSHCQPAASFPWERVSQAIEADGQAMREFIARDEAQPFFLVVASDEPHLPWDQGDRSIYPPDQLIVPPYLVDTPETREALSRYYAEITYLDGQLGSVLELVKSEQLDDRTLVIFTSEQGSQLPFGGKWTCYENGLKTALIIRWPGHTRPGTRTDAMVQYVDVIPTLLEAVGGSPEQIDTGIGGAPEGGNGFDGRSFVDVLVGASDRHRRLVYGVHTTRGIINGSRSYPIRSARGTRFKYIRNLNPESLFTNIVTQPARDAVWASWLADETHGRERARQYRLRSAEELYDLAEDPFELNNLAGREEMQPILLRMRAELDAWMRQQGDRGLDTEAMAEQRQGERRQQQAAEVVDPVIQSEFVYDDAPFPECHASTLAETDEGLVVAWFGGTHERHEDVGIWIACHRDGDWTAPVEVANGVQYQRVDDTVHRHPCWNPVLFVAAPDRLQLFYKCGPSPSQWWGMLTESDDRGASWSTPIRLPEGIDGPVKNKPIQLEDGTLLCGSSTEYDGWRVHFELTNDHGATWTRVGPLNDGRDLGAIQPTLLAYPDGRIQALCRNQDGQGRVWQTWSDDQGRSWSPLTATDLPNPNSGVDGVTLEDGRQLLVYNHTIRRGEFPSGREMLNVALSVDGRQWSAALMLEREDGEEFSYPSVIQTADGLVHICYTWKRERIRHVVLDPEQLDPRPFADGDWPD